MPAPKRKLIPGKKPVDPKHEQKRKKAVRSRAAAEAHARKVAATKAAADRAEHTSREREGWPEDDMPDPDMTEVAAPHPGEYDPLDPPVETSPRMGRPPKYDPKFVDIVRGIAKLGATDDQIAECLGVSIATIKIWKVQYPDFLASMKAGKDEADERVERTLYQRAVGYQRDAVKIFMPAGAMEPVYAPFREEVQGDVTAQIFWLKNRRRDEWRDVKSQELSGPGGDAIRIGSADDDLAAARRIAFALTQALQRQEPAAAAVSSEPKVIEGEVIDVPSTVRDAAE